jgi:hypothetical protein
MRLARLRCQAAGMLRVQTHDPLDSTLMNIEHNLTAPQLKLLMTLRTRPRPLAPHYRPLGPLVEQEFVRPRHVGVYGSNPTYELTEKGKELTQSILEEQAR